MKILIATDTWTSSVNGVVTTMTNIVRELRNLGHNVLVICPEIYRNIPSYIYPDAIIPIWCKKEIYRNIQEFKPDFIHISTEFRIGNIVRKYCIKNGLKFTTSYHTKFPEYCRRFFKVPAKWIYPYFRKFHNSGNGCMVATQSLLETMQAQGFTNLKLWNRGVNLENFAPTGNKKLDNPYIVYVGRVSKEKNIEAFLELPSMWKKIVVGDGPINYVNYLKKRYPKVEFVGVKKDKELARYYSQATICVFPSKTDTFGMTILESMACGTPVAAYDVTGPKDIILDKVTGGVDEQLHIACLEAYKCDPAKCLEFAKKQTWENCTQLFLDNLVHV